MRTVLIAGVVLGAFVFLMGCSDVVQPVASRERMVPVGFAAMEHPADNAPSAERIALGKRLFFDSVMSRDYTVSCGTCHRPEYAFSDASIVSRGVEGRQGTRNTPSIVNVGYQPYFLREGGVPTLEMQVLVPIQEHAEFDMNILDVADRLKADPTYVQLSQKAYARDPDPFVITRAIAAYERTLISSNARYDLFVRFGDPTLMTESERRGMSLFMDASVGCATCHGTPHFTTFGFANNGLYETFADDGRFRLTGEESDRGVFKIPSLRNIAVTAPYMHDGSLYSLELVIKHYNDGGKQHPNQDARVRPLGLTERQQEDLVAFLYSLTDEDFVNSPALRK